MEFIYLRGDAEFERQLRKARRRLRRLGYYAPPPESCVLNATELGGENRVRLIWPARLRSMGATQEVRLLRGNEAGLQQLVPADFFVPLNKLTETLTYDGEWSKWAEPGLQGSRGNQHVVLGRVPGDTGLGRRVCSALHPMPTMRATLFEDAAD